MIQLDITKTGKSFNPKEKYQMIDHKIKYFGTIQEAKDWIKEIYGKSKKSKMFVNTKEGKTIHVGYIIGFKSADYSHTPVENWLQQDWIEFKEVKSVDLGIKEKE